MQTVNSLPSRPGAALIFFSLVMIACFSCKKDASSAAGGTNPAVTKVEYVVSPSDSYLTKIVYTDEKGNAATVTDYTQFKNGTLAISVSKRPFDAGLQVTVDNPSNAIMNYVIGIKVDGDVKKYASLSVPAMTSNTGTVTYTVP